MDTTNEATRVPLDYDSINKGDVIPLERIEHIVRCARTHPQYRLRVLALADQVMRDMDALGRPVTVVQRGDTLVVLTSAEAAQYNTIQSERARRKQVRQFRRLVKTVEASDLEPDQLQSWQRSVEVNGRYLQAMKETGKSLRLESYKRTTPGLPTNSHQP